jgi:prohibitin 1
MLYVAIPTHINLVPLGIAAALVQSSIYDVPGGYRAVMFDRFSGVKSEVSLHGICCCC